MRASDETQFVQLIPDSDDVGSFEASKISHGQLLSEYLQLILIHDSSHPEHEKSPSKICKQPKATALKI